MSDCLPRRKRHYFGRDTGAGGGMGINPCNNCVWCGKERTRPYHPKWRTLLSRAMEIHGKIENKELLTKKDHKFIGKVHKMTERKKGIDCPILA